MSDQTEIPSIPIFFKTLFGGLPGNVFLTALGQPTPLPERRMTTRKASEIEAFVARWDRAGRAVYFAVNPLREGAEQRSKASVAALGTLYIDIDLKDVDKPETAYLTLINAPFPPTAIVSSGNGLHCYWRLTDHLEPTPENVAMVERLMRQLAWVFAADTSAAEIARVLRIPGSHNWKKPADPKPVDLFLLKTDAAHDIADIDEWLAMGGGRLLTPKEASRAPDTPEGYQNPFLSVSVGIAAPLDVEEMLGGMRLGGGETGIHNTELRAVASLLSSGHDVEDVVELVFAKVQEAVADDGKGWDWRRERRTIERMANSWLGKPRIAEEIAAKRQERAAEQEASDFIRGTGTQSGVNPTPRVQSLAEARGEAKPHIPPPDAIPPQEDAPEALEPHEYTNGHTAIFEALTQVEQPIELVWAHQLGEAKGIDWLVDNLIPAKGMTTITGESWAGKSVLTIDLAHALAEGVDWADRKTKRSGVLYLSFEGQGGIPNRFFAARDHRDVSQDEPLPIFVIRTSLGSFMQAGSSESKARKDALYDLKRVFNLIERAKHELAKMGIEDLIIVFDTFLAAAYIQSENDSAEIQEAVRVLDRLREVYGVTVIVLDHLGKDTTKGTRGSSAKEASADVVLVIEGENNERELGGPRVLRVRKMRDGEVDQEFPFEIVGHEINPFVGTAPVIEWGKPRDKSIGNGRRGRKADKKGTDKILRDGINELARSDTTAPGLSGVNGCYEKDLKAYFTERQTSTVRDDPDLTIKEFDDAMRRARDHMVLRFQRGVVWLVKDDEYTQK